MAKTMIFDHATTRKYRMVKKFNGKKVMSHGAYRAKRKPNSPIIKKAEAVKRANFGKVLSLSSLSTVLWQSNGPDSTRDCKARAIRF